MTRNQLALRLSALVALAGLLPIAIVGIVSVEVLRRRSERTVLASLQTIAGQVAERTEGYLAQQREIVRTAAATISGEDAERRLQELVLDTPGVGNVRLLEPGSEGPKSLSAEEFARALKGEEVASSVYIANGATPAMDLCVPALALRPKIVCAQLDLLELWRFVQRVRVGNSGYVLVFDENRHLVASGAGELRAAVLTGDEVAQARYIQDARGKLAMMPDHYDGAGGEPVLAAWSALPTRAWTVAVEQPVAEAVQIARVGQWVLIAVLVLALLISIGVGVLQSRRMIGELQLEERWRTAGRIAAGLTHDLGHRLRILQQTAGLAEANEPAFLPQIADNLRSEVRTLKKFISDFSDLSRDVRALELHPLEMGAFLQSVKRTADPHAQSANVRLDISALESPLWASADRYLMERALLNLLSNAIEASPKDSIIHMRAGVDGDQRWFEVEDHGAGIAPERLARLFDAFVSTKRTGAHIGMGLANVKRIVDAHGGRVSVASEPGKGSRFRITLSGAMDPAAAPQSSSSSPAPGASS